MSTIYVVTGVDTGIPRLPNDSVIAGLKVGDTFTTTLDPAVEAELIGAGLIAKSPVSSPVVLLADGTLAAEDGRTPSGGSGGPQFTGFPGIVFGLPTATLAFDGSSYSVPWVKASPPSFMDDAGHITEPGLYAIGVMLNVSTAPTTPGLFVMLTGYSTDIPYPVDGLGVDLGLTWCSDVFSLAAGDLPLGSAMSVQLPTDATGTIDIQGLIQQVMGPAA